MGKSNIIILHNSKSFHSLSIFVLSTMFGALLSTHSYIYTTFVACRILALPKILFSKTVNSKLKIWSITIILYSVLSQIFIIFWFAVDFVGSDKMMFVTKEKNFCGKMTFAHFYANKQRNIAM